MAANVLFFCSFYRSILNTTILLRWGERVNLDPSGTGSPQKLVSALACDVPRSAPQAYREIPDTWRFAISTIEKVRSARVSGRLVAIGRTANGIGTLAAGPSSLL
jgi:hypothetical protein